MQSLASDYADHEHALGNGRETETFDERRRDALPDFEKRQELRQRSNLAAAAEEITRVGMKISEFAHVLNLKQ